MNVRKAELRDVPALFKLINRYAVQQVLLPRPLTNLYEDVWEFTVAEEDGKLLGCGALKFYSQELAEIRSLCVDQQLKSKGVGRKLTEALLDEAERYGLKTVFALTVVPAFFDKLGFQQVLRERFPAKVYEDCLGCPKHSCCDEIAVSYELAWRRTEGAEAPSKLSTHWAERADITRAACPDLSGSSPLWRQRLAPAWSFYICAEILWPCAPCGLIAPNWPNIWTSTSTMRL